MTDSKGSIPHDTLKETIDNGQSITASSSSTSTSHSDPTNPSPAESTPANDHNAALLLPPSKTYHLPHNITLHHPTQALLPYLSNLNKTLLQVNYPTKFYTSMLQQPTRLHLCFLATHHTSTRPIGAICCDLVPLPSPPAHEKDETGWIYIQTLGVLSPYRGYGLGSGMIDKVVEEAREFVDVRGAWAHVWEGNEDGLKWYVNRGFEVYQKVSPYYRKLTPSGAWIVVRRGDGGVKAREGKGGILEELERGKGGAEKVED
jgi:N-alpha-acetyltransferase 50